MPALPPGDVAILFVSTLTAFPVPSVKNAWRVARMPELEIFWGPNIEAFVYSVIVFAVGSSRPTLLAAVSANQTFPSRSVVMEFGFVPRTTKCWKLPFAGRFHRVRLEPRVAEGSRRRI